RKVDGRRVFSTAFKRDTVQQNLTGEKTVGALSRELRQVEHLRGRGPHGGRAAWRARGPTRRIDSEDMHVVGLTARGAGDTHDRSRDSTRSDRGHPDPPRFVMVLH